MKAQKLTALESVAAALEKHIRAELADLTKQENLNQKPFITVRP
jgi:hypothetical protein